ncbi:hypothetical protein DSECCO2_288490 [anaerobic digester metagenome]|nr:SHOCT domain-containing protein [Clostridiaceae bacterium HFYG-1003]
MHPFYGPSSMMIGDVDFWWVGLVSMALYLLFWAGAIVLAVRLLRKIGLGRWLPKPDDAMAILRERYARGEIDQAEFREKAADLADTAPTDKP